MAHDVNGQALAEGDRVKTLDFSGWVYGTLHKNTKYPHVSEWYVAFDDGEEYAVLSYNNIWKVNEE
jgi:hypothetical protein